MEKYHKQFFYIGCALALLPIYHFFSWIYVWNMYIEYGRREVVAVFNDLFFGLLSNSIVMFLFGLIACVLLGMSMHYTLNNRRLGNRHLKIVAFVICVLFTMWIVWGNL